MRLWDILSIVEDNPCGVICNGEVLDGDEVLEKINKGEVIHTLSGL